MPKPFKIKDRILIRLATLSGYLLLRLLRMTMRLEFRNTDKVDVFWKNGKNAVIAFWHSRQLMLPFVYAGRGKVSVLVSSHRDGELIAQTIGYFGMGTLRGSSTRGGVAALKGLVRAARAGEDIGVTPDGPRGPKQIVQMGVIELAKLTGLPIVSLAFNASSKKKFIPGTNSSFLTHSAGVFTFGGIRFGFHGTPIGP